MELFHESGHRSSCISDSDATSVASKLMDIIVQVFRNLHRIAEANYVAKFKAETGVSYQVYKKKDCIYAVAIALSHNLFARIEIDKFVTALYPEIVKRLGEWEMNVVTTGSKAVLFKLQRA